MAKTKKVKYRLLNSKYALLALVMLSTIALSIALIFYNKPASADPYPIKGFDVSHHQGEINWKKVSPEKYQFVYLKATEGGDYQDDQFQNYWLKAREQGLHVGAYHFFRLCRDGIIQAKNFIATVPNKPDALPPVMDLEYDSKCINTYTREQLIQHIQIMHDQLQAHYGKQPIFYTSKNFYNMVLLGEFKHTPIWIREYKDQPNLKDGQKWTFWQHSNQGKISGIEKPVDLNVFYGDAKAWQDFLTQSQILQK